MKIKKKNKCMGLYSILDRKRENHQREELKENFKKEQVLKMVREEKVAILRTDQLYMVN
jgi:hypothetical protein